MPADYQQCGRGQERVHGCPARNSRFDEAGEHLAAAGEKMKEAHHVHTRLITMDASGELDKIGLIMIHSEDIMMGAEITLALAKEMVEMYKTH